MARAVQRVRGFRELVARYDGFLLDQWGVMHDGSQALPGANDCVRRLHALGKPVVILSNSSKRAPATLERLPEIGLDGACRFVESTPRERSKATALQQHSTVETASLGHQYCILQSSADHTYTVSP